MLAGGAVSLVLSEYQPLPAGLRSAGLVLLGTYVGSSLDRQDSRLVRPELPSALAILALVTAGCASGLIVHPYLAPDLAVGTVILGTMPGGISGLTAVAGDLGAEFGLVASIRMVRLMAVFGLLPLVLARIARSVGD
jgi:membrane AbrB-like protein